MKAAEDVEFPTVDGLVLRGRLYPSMEKGPGIIITPGFNFTKEMMVGEVAEYFQHKGFTALAFDPRSIGQSDGEPRNNIDPLRNVEDYHDALTFLKSDPRVDSSKIVFWGYSYSAMIALVASALDKRAKAVVAVCPLTIWEFPEDKWASVLRTSMRDRESCILGNKPVYIPMLTESGDNPAGFGSGYSREHFKLVAGAKQWQPNFQMPTTLASYYKIAAFQPLPLIRHVTPTPALVVVPENDVVSPSEMQRRLVFEVLGEPKQLLEVPGKGHMDVLSGPEFSEILDEQCNYLSEVL